MARIPIAVQLYSIRNQCAADLPASLKAVAQMGYEGVEFAGWHGYDAATLRAMLDDNGLKCAGAHIGIDTLLGDELEKSVAFHRTLGSSFLIVPGLAEKWRSSTQAWRETADVFNQIAERLKPHGMQTGYHNHHIEFQPFAPGGELPWDTFFGNTVSEVVMQFDTGNALHGGSQGQAIAYLTRYPGRAQTIHLKDHDLNTGSDDPPVGEGSVPFEQIFQICETTGKTQWYIVEYEAEAYEPMEGIKRCLKNVKAMGR